MKDKNTYYREYMLKRYHQRMDMARQKLGGKCCHCGSEDKLEIDHINSEKKKFTIASFWSCKLEIFNKELEKCQLLCIDCHIKKTILDIGKKPAKNTHGTLSSYRYCKCDLCREAKRKYAREYRKKNKTFDKNKK